jgi:hypothetical protein
MKRNFYFTCTLLFYCSCVFGQPIHVLNINELITIQKSYGNDSLRKSIDEIPVWYLDSSVALSLLLGMNGSDRYDNSWEWQYIIRFCQTIKSDKAYSKLTNLLDFEIGKITNTDYLNKEIRKISDEILLALIFQNGPGVENYLESTLSKLQIIRDSIIVLQPRKKKLSYFFKGWPPILWNNSSIKFNIFKLLSALNIINPSKYQSSDINMLRKELHPMQRDYRLAIRKINEFYSSREEVANDEIIDGVSVQKNLVSSFYRADKNCWIRKLIKDENTYMLEMGCVNGPLSGAGETYLIKRMANKVSIYLIAAWKS